MGRLRRAPDVISIAKNLGLNGNDPVEAIMNYCRTRVESWLKEFKGPISLPRLHQIVDEHLSLRHVVVTTDQELDDLIREQTGLGQVIFHTIKDEFAQGTQAITVKLKNPGLGMKRHLAVIDGRRDRAWRVFFSKRHENSHLLTLTSTQMSFVFRRTHAKKTPGEELLMDKIGGELAFYPLLSRPELHRLQRRYGRPCFRLVEDLKTEVCPEASQTAMAIAAIEQNEVPALLVTGRYASKTSDQGNPPASWALRASVKGNMAGRRAGLVIPWNYRIPPTSIIHHIFHHIFHESSGPQHAHADERLGAWTSSDGSRLRDLPVHIEVRKYQDHVLAIITLE